MLYNARDSGAELVYLKVSQVSPSCPFDNRSMKMRMKTKVKVNEKLWWNDSDVGQLSHSVSRLGENMKVLFEAFGLLEFYAA